MAINAVTSGSFNAPSYLTQKNETGSSEGVDKNKILTTNNPNVPESVNQYESNYRDQVNLINNSFERTWHSDFRFNADKGFNNAETKARFQQMARTRMEQGSSKINFEDELNAVASGLANGIPIDAGFNDERLKPHILNLYYGKWAEKDQTLGTGRLDEIGLGHGMGSYTLGRFIRDRLENALKNKYPGDSEAVENRLKIFDDWYTRNRRKDNPIEIDGEQQLADLNSEAWRNYNENPYRYIRAPQLTGDGSKNPSTPWQEVLDEWVSQVPAGSWNGYQQEIFLKYVKEQGGADLAKQWFSEIQAQAT